MVAFGNAGRDRIDEYTPSRDAAHDAGGLLSLYLGNTHPAVLGKLGVLSPSVRWDNRWVVRQLAADPGQRPSLRIWLDVGTREHRMLRGTRLMYRMLVRRGWRPGE